MIVYLEKFSRLHNKTQCILNWGRLTQFAKDVVHLLPVFFGSNNAEEQASGAHPGTVRAHGPAAAEAAGPCQPLEPAGAHAILYVAEHGCKWRGLPVGGANSRRTGRLFVVGERRDSLAAPRRLPCVIRTADHATERGVISDRSDA